MLKKMLDTQNCLIVGARGAAIELDFNFFTRSLFKGGVLLSSHNEPSGLDAPLSAR
jgi:hypothetical protein